MAEDSEKRLQSIMDKLFQSPRLKSKDATTSPSSSGMNPLIGKKRPYPTSTLSLVNSNMGLDNAEEVQSSAGMLQAPVCRPWNRGDLMKRLATFKSMTWFAKPQVVSAVNCARRGWVNVDTDTIACEACGARILFSTSSSWSREQVEKAALVFGLKLDSGHRLLCPWMDNACDETLAQFPPTSPPVLVDQFRERSSSLANLWALPVVSSSAIEFMRSQQLDQFLQQSFMLEYFNVSPEIPSAYQEENGLIPDSAHLYYQALKLISLCGWEPRQLPYVVDYKIGVSDGTGEQINLSSSSNVHPGGEKSIACIPTADHNPAMEASRSSESVADPKSVVLDCKLCGASVGLWAFFTIERPLEAFRLVGYTGISNEKNGSTQDYENRSNPTSSAGPNAPSSNLNRTIAGGPPPTHQNFKAIISLPIIGRSIRARFSSDCDLRNRLLVNQVHGQSESRNTDVSLRGEDSCRATESTIGDLPPLCNNHSEGSAGHREGDEKSMLIDSTEGTLATHTNNISGEASTQNEAGLFQNNIPKGVENIRYESNSSKKELQHDNTGKHTWLRTADKGMEFDPIRQHRHFCPWIASTGGIVPGWQQVLSALLRQIENPHHSPSTPPPDSLIKVDDPITSVRRLFTSKRTKPSQGSS